MQVSKRRKKLKELTVAGKNYNFNEAVSILNEAPAAKFDQSVDVAIVLGVNPKRSNEVVKGAEVLPNGLGKKVEVAVFAQGDNVAAAKEAGADYVGLNDLADDLKAGKISPNVVIASPDTMAVVGRLGQVLGPKGLMPNPKLGTVTTDVATAVKNAKSGQVRFKTDKAGIVHCSIGKMSFSESALKQNLEQLLTAVKKAKPVAAKGTYMKKLYVSSSMGPSVRIDLADLNF